MGNVNYQVFPNVPILASPSTRSLSYACQPQGPLAGQPQGFSAGSEVQCSVVQVPSMERQVMASLLLSCQGLCEPGERLIFKLSVLGHHIFCTGNSTGWKAAPPPTTLSMGGASCCGRSLGGTTMTWIGRHCKFHSGTSTVRSASTLLR